MQTMRFRNLLGASLSLWLDAKLGGAPWPGQRTAIGGRTTTRELIKVLGLNMSWETF